MFNHYNLNILRSALNLKGKKCFGQKGFTLIEMIMVLVLLGIVGVGVGLGLTQVIQGYVFTKKAAETMSKAQLAMLRISKELRVCDTKDISGTDKLITFKAPDENNALQTYTLEWKGVGFEDLKLNNDILVDRVSSFVLNYYDTYDGTVETSWTTDTKIVEVVLNLKGPRNDNDVEFRTRVSPRNITY